MVRVSDAEYIQGLYEQSVLNANADKSLKELYQDVDGYSYITSTTTTAFGDGVLAMANSGANTNGSQFFLTMTGAEETTKHLNGKHTVFGIVTDGQNVIDRIGRVDTDAQNRPKKDVVIESVTIEER